MPRTIIRPDEMDPPRLYSLSVEKYCGVYIGLLMVFYSWGNRRAPGCPQESETIDIHLTFSRDGWSWERLANRPVFIPRGNVGTFDCGMLSPCNPPFVQHGDHLLIYYTAHDGAHNLEGRSTSLGVARLPKERFVARVAGDEVGRPAHEADDTPVR